MEERSVALPRAHNYEAKTITGYGGGNFAAEREVGGRKGLSLVSEARVRAK